jgi:hypothetical protein
MLVDIGWGIDQIGLATNIVGSTLAIATALLAGVLLTRMTRKAALIRFQVLQAVLLLPLLLPALGTTSYLLNFLAVGIAVMSYSMAATAITTVMMDTSRPDAAGTDYTLQHSLAHLMSFAAMGLGLMLAGQVVYAVVVVAAIGFALLSAASVWWLFVPDAQIEQDRTDAFLSTPAEVIA